MPNVDFITDATVIVELDSPGSMPNSYKNDQVFGSAVNAASDTNEIQYSSEDSYTVHYSPVLDEQGNPETVSGIGEYSSKTYYVLNAYILLDPTKSDTEENRDYFFRTPGSSDGDNIGELTDTDLGRFYVATDEAVIINDE